MNQTQIIMSAIKKTQVDDAIEYWHVGIPETLSQTVPSKNCFQNSFPLILLRLCSRVFQQLHDVCYHNRLNGEPDRRIQLCSIKPDGRDLQKI